MDTPPPTPPYLKMSKDLEEDARANEEKVTLRNPSQRLIPLTDELKKAMENFSAWFSTNGADGADDGNMEDDDDVDKDDGDAIADESDESSEEKGNDADQVMSKEKVREHENEKDEDETILEAAFGAIGLDDNYDEGAEYLDDSTYL